MSFIMCVKEELELANEAYFGKNKKLEAIEKQIGVARQKYLGKNVAENFYNDKNIEKVGKMLADYFGFYYVDFNLSNSPMPNAWTLVGSKGFSSLLRSEYYGCIKRTTEGFKMDSKTTFDGLWMYTRVTTALWNDEAFTDAEVLAIVLHEIGHNFANRNNVIKYLDLFTALEAWLLIGTTGGSYLFNAFMGDSEYRAQLGKYMKDSPALSSLVNVFSSVSGFIKVLGQNLNALAKVLFAPTSLIKDVVMTGISVLNQVRSNPMTLILTPFGKAQEYISDDFASKLGYGPELSSALIKMGNYKGITNFSKVMGNIPFFRGFNDLSTLLVSVLYAPIDSHPGTGRRIGVMKKSLEKELAKTDIDPKLRKIIQKDLDDIELIGNTLADENVSKIKSFHLKFGQKGDMDPITKIIADRTVNEMSTSEFNEYLDTIFETGELVFI